MSLFATGTDRPATSTLNLATGAVDANAAITVVGTAGQIRLFNAQGSTNALLDLAGYFEPAPA